MAPVTSFETFTHPLDIGSYLKYDVVGIKFNPLTNDFMEKKEYKSFDKKKYDKDLVEFAKTIGCSNVGYDGNGITFGFEFALAE